VTRAQYTILAVVFTLVGMAVMLSMSDLGNSESHVQVTEIDLETTLRIPGEEGTQTLKIPGEISEENLARPQKIEGLPPRPEPQPPLNDAAEWRKQRDEMAAVWREESVRGVETYVAKAGLSADQRQDVLNTVLVLHERYEEVRQRLEDNTTTREDALVDIGAVDEWGKQQLEAVLGEEGAELLRQEMELNRTNK
jgi:hypothetical protein